MKKHYFKLMLLVLAIFASIGQMYGWTNIWLMGDVTSWSSRDCGMSEFSDGDNYVDVYIATNQCFKLWVYSDESYNKVVGPSSDQYGMGINTNNTHFDNSYWGNAAKYTGNNGIVRFRANQKDAGNGDANPWVYLQRPTVVIKHDFTSGGSWEQENMTDNSDGTYVFIGSYNGTGVNVGTSEILKYIKNPTINNGGSGISNGTRCFFDFNASGFKGNVGGEEENAGSVTITRAITVSFNMNGHGSSISSQEIRWNTRATDPGTPSAEGYDFGGWFEEAGCENEWDFDDNVAPNTNSKTLYAKWTEKSYSLTFTTDGHGTVAVGGVDVASGSTASVNHHTTKTLVATNNTGYNFSSWTLSGSNTSAVTIGNTSNASTTIKTSDTGATVRANFSAKNYTVTLDDNGGTEDGSATATYNATSLGSISAPTKAGYHPEGYYTNADCSIKVATPAGVLQNNVTGFTTGTAWTLDDDVTLHTKWTANTYYVRFNKNSEDATGTMSDQSFTYDADKTALTSNAFSRTGYKFDYWLTGASSGDRYDDGDKVKNLTTTKDDIFNLYAQWDAKTYTITLDNQAAYTPGSHDSGEADEYTVTYDKNFLKEHQVNAPSSYNYDFGGYYTAVAGGGDQIINNYGLLTSGTTAYTTSGVWKNAGNVTVYAKWSVAQTLSKNTYDAYSTNGTITLTYNSGTTSGYTASTRPGYNLDGYYTAADGGTKVINADGTIVAGTVSGYVSSGVWVYNNLTSLALYAHWTPITYTVSFAHNDDASYVGEEGGTAPDDIEVDYEDNVMMPKAGDTKIFTRDGYSLIGWSIEDKKAKGSNSATLISDYNYAAGSTYSGLTTEDESTVTLFPKWLGNIYTVSFNARGGIGLYPTSMDVRYGETYGSGNYGSLPSPTPPSGYAFVGWYTSTSGGTLVTAETQMTTIGAHTLYARYAAKKQVYFKNSLGWDTVYVTFDAMWDGGQGAGNEGRTYRTMSRIAGTDIWYHDIPDSYLSGWAFNIAFNDTFQTGFHAFTAGEAVYREDFDSLATLFVPKNTDYMGEDGKGIDGNYPKNGVNYISTGYKDGTSSNPQYTSGYWMKYNDYYSGYELTYQKNGAGSWETGKKMKTGIAGDTTFVYTVKMDADCQYNFAFYKEVKAGNNKSRQYRYASEINSNNCTDIKLACDPDNAWMKTTVAGDYKFILTTKKDGHMYLTIEYPFASGDYKVVYSYTKGGAQTYESEYIKARENGKDTISVFIHSGDSATSRALTIHKCTGITDGVATWNTSYASITLPSETASGKTSAVYNIAITQDESSAASGSVIEKYEGDYYIRTWCADGGWDQYKEREDNVMTYSAYSMTQTLSDPYSHYYCRFVGSTSTDITYAIATKYSPNISGIKTGDGTIGNAATTLPAAANVRFSWNSETNAMQRAYIKPAQGGDYDNSRFLVMHGAEDGMIFNPNGSAIGAAGDLAANELQFEDKGDWLYQVMLQAVPRAEVSIIAKYNNADRYLVGGATSYTKIMGGTGSDKYTIMAVYDFKTNRLMNAWTPGGEISEKLDTVDMLWIRYKQEEAQQITFSEDGSLANVTTVGAIQLDYDDLVGHVASWTYETRPLLRYFISFPFDVNVSDIFGLHGAELGRDFVIRKYDGAERAKNGLFLGDGDTYWVDLTMDSVMHANEGYSLVFDNEYLNGDLGSIWENKTGGSSVYLYFPAADKIASISDANKTTTLAQHLCEDARTYISGGVSISHANSDSHWNLIGSPLFVNSYVYSSTGTNGQTGVAEKRTLDSYYAYDAEWNRWIPTLYYNDSRKEYYACKAMHAMLVQFAGSVEWSKTAPTPPSSVAARERKETTVTNRLITLNLMQNGEKGDHTYIKMDENGYSDFMLCEDLYKIIYKNKPMLFSYAGQNCVAYNKVAIESQTINLGIEIRQNDTYTFTMPENVAGQVTLVDHFAQTRTNLNIEDYEVYLNKGNYYDRFAIEIKVNEAPTAIDGVQDGSGSLKDGKAHKFIMNDMLYILKNGEIFDARGNRVR